MSDILNIGIIGAGRIGKVHAATLAYRIPSARVLAIADIDLAAAQQTAGQFCIPVAVDDAAAVLANPRHRRCADLRVHRHTRQVDHRGGAGRQAHLL